MSTRTKVVTGLALLVAFWVAAAAPALTEAVRVMSARVTADHLGGPLGALVLALEAERRLSASPALAASGPSSDPAGDPQADGPSAGDPQAGDPAAGPDAAGPEVAGPELAAQRARTDQAREALRSTRESWIAWLADSDSTRQTDELLKRTDRLGAVRAAVDGKQMTHHRAVDAYTALIDPAGLGTPTVHPDQLAGSAGGLSALSRSRELLAEQDAHLAAMASRRAKLTDADRRQLSTLAGARRSLFAAAGGDLPASVAAQYEQLAGETSLTAAENELLAGSGGAPAWSAAYNQVNTGLWDLQTSGTRAAAGAATGHAVLTVVRAGLIGGVGLIAVIAVFLVARRSGGRTSTSGGMRRPVAEHATGEIPLPLEPLLRDLERRNQSLLHRQLRLLDTLARRESDDETLGDLFRADHLANRMRRNLEKAITLAGGVPGRRWHRPVPISEVIRGAASEVNDYGRVSTSQVEPVLLAGVAVTDLMHLLAELIENGTTFAPAETRVRVTGATDTAGYRITVTDVGPGMDEDDLARAVEVLTDPSPPTGGTWWGLYAAGRFAARHDIAVALHNGADGGLTAEVTVPATLLSPAEPMDDNEPTVDDLEPVMQP
jgi:signal transduction histidine kinase